MCEKGGLFIIYAVHTLYNDPTFGLQDRKKGIVV